MARMERVRQKDATMLDTPLVSVRQLRVEFETNDGPVVGVEDVSFEVKKGETGRRLE